MTTMGLAAGAAERPSAEYVDAMKTLAVVAQEMPKRLAADDADGMEQLVYDARPALAVLEQYWTARAVDEAVELAQAASKAIAEISVAVHLMEDGPNPLATEGAEQSLKNLAATCVSCHAAYRETLPDGSYAIK